MADNGNDINSFNRILDNNFSLENISNKKIQEMEVASEKARASVARNMAITADRTVGEIAGDTVTAIGPKFVLSTAQGVYGAADLISRMNPATTIANAVDDLAGTNFSDAFPSLDDTTGRLNEYLTGDKVNLSQGFGKAQEMLKVADSAPLQAQNELIARLSQERAAGKEDRIAADMAQGDSEFYASAKDLGEDIIESGAAYIDNPTALGAIALESAPQLFMGGLVGKAAQKNVLKTMTPDAAKKFVASKEGKKVLEKAAEKANIGYVAASEGFTQATQTKADVLNMSEEELFKSSPKYKELRETLDHNQAKEEVADIAFDIALLVTAGVAGTASKVSGAAKFEGNLFTPTSRIGKALSGNALQKGASAGIKETIEEAVQSGGGAFAGNIAKKAAADENQQLTEGVGEQIAAGGLAGGLTGAAIGSGSGIINDASRVIEASNEAIKKANEKVAKSDPAKAVKLASKAKKVIEEGKQETVYDTTSKDYDAELAVQVALDKSNVGETVESIKSAIELASKHTSNMFKEAMALNAKVDDNTTEAEKKAATATLERSREYIKRIGALKELTALSDEEISTQVKAINDSSDKASAETVEQVLRSTPSIEQAETLLASNKLDETDTTRVKNYVGTQKAIAALGTDEVHAAILNGDETNLGIKDYMTSINTAVSGGNIESAKEVYGNLSTFAKRHAVKVKDISDAFTAYRSDPNTPLVQTIKDKYGFTVNARSPKAIRNMVLEVSALKAAVKEAKFNVDNGVVTSAPTTVSTPVATKPVSDTVAPTPAAKPTTQSVSNQAQIDLVNGSKLPAERKEALVSKLTNVESLSPVDKRVLKELTETKNKEVAAAKAEKLDKAVDRVLKKDINASTLKPTLTTSNQKVDRPADKAAKTVAGIKRTIKKFIDRAPEARKPEALRNIAAGIAAYNEGVPTDKLKSSFHRAGYRIAKNFLRKPSYTVKRVLQRSEFAKENYKIRGSKSALANKENFFETYDRETEAYKDYSIEDKAKFDDIAAYTDDFKQAFEASFALTKETDLSRSPIQEFLREENGFERDANIVSAMAITGYNWIADRVDTGRITTDEGILAMFPSREGQDSVSKAERAMFADVGVNRKQLAISLGRDFLGSIGVGSKRSTPRQLKDKLELSAGLTIIEALEEQGLVESTSIKNSDIAKVIGDDNAKGDTNRNTVFVNIVASNKDATQPSEILSSFTSNMSGGRKILEEVFAVESRVSGPSYDVPSFEQKTLKGTNQSVPKRLAKIIQKHMARPHVFKDSLMSVFMSLDETTQEAIGGVDHDTSKLHAEERKSADAKNDALKRELKHLEEFYGNSEDTSKPFYFTHVIWKNFRMGIASNTINPQTSKIHRHALGLKDFVVTVNTRVAKELQTFNIAVGESLGTSPDKNNSENSEKEALEIINSEVIQNAVSAYREILEKGSTPALAKELADGVKAGGNAMYSLDGIAALAAQQEAYENGFTSFTTDLGREVDGVTNGVAIGLSQLVSSKAWGQLEKMLARTGLFTDTEAQYGDWSNTPGNYDSYEDTSLSWVSKLREIHNVFATGVSSDDLPKKVYHNIKKLKEAGITERQLNAARSLVGTFRAEEKDSFGNDIVSKVGRALAKNPLMITNYGAAMAKVVQEFVGEIVSKIHKNAADAQNKIEEGKAEGNREKIIQGQNELANLNAALKELLGPKAKVTKEIGLTDPALLERFELILGNYYGAALETAIKEKFGTFIESRTLMNDGLNSIADMFNEMYEARVEEATQKWIKNNPDKKFIDLTSDEYLEIERQIIELAPIAKNFYSDTADDSAMLSNQEDALDPKQRGRVSVGRKKPKAVKTRSYNAGTVSEGMTKPQKTLSSSAPKKRYASPGVGGVISLIHGMDASTMYGLIDQFAGLNVHDAIMFPLTSLEEGTTALNDSFAEVVLGDYSIVNEIAKSYQDTLTAYTDYKGLDNVGKPLTALSSRLDAASKETSMYREELREKIKVIQQYNKGEGGRATRDYTSPNLAALKDSIKADENVARETAELPASDNLLSEEVAVEYPELQEIINNLLVAASDQKLGSSDSFIDADNFNADTIEEVDALGTEAVFSRLANVGAKKDSASHTTRLGDVLTGLVNGALEPIKLEIRRLNAETGGVNVGNRVLLDTGTSPLVNSLQLSAQETFVHELVHNVTKYGLNASKLASKQVERLWELSRKTIKATDFLSRDAAGNVVDKNNQAISETSPEYASELAEATKRYDYIYNNTATDSAGRNAYLHEFLTFGLTNAAFITALGKINTRDLKGTQVIGEGIVEKLWGMFVAIVNKITDRATDTHNIAVDSALMILAQDLAKVEQHKKNLLVNAYEGYGAAFDSGVRTLANWVLTPISKLANSNKAQEFAAVRSATKVIAGINRNGYSEYRKAVKEVVRRVGISEKSFLVSFAHEVNGSNKLSLVWEKLSRLSNKMVDQLRIDVSKKLAGHLNDSFIKDSLTTEKRAAITKGLLKTDLSSLLDDDAYSFNQIRGFINDRAKLRNEIDSLISQLEQFGENQHYYRKMAESLGHIMATGVPLQYESKLNAYNIANLTETGKEVIGDVNTANEIIDQLASLHALSYTSAKDISALQEVVNAEHKADPEHNGFTFTLKAHKDNKERAFEQLFNNDPTQFVKGYTKELFDPNISIEYGTLSDQEVMAKSNYNLVTDNGVEVDAFDPNKEKIYLYLNKDGVVTTWQAGVTSLTSKRAKGTSLLTKRLRETNDVVRGMELGQEDLEAYYAGKEERLRAIFSEENSAVKGNALVPIITPSGDTAGYRYMMGESTKNNLLNKNNDFAQVLGGMEAGIVDKVNTVEINKLVVKNAYEQFKEEYASNQNGFVYVGMDSKDPEYRELYQMLPKEMRMNIKRTWKQHGMYVPDTLVPLIFGQRKISISNLASPEHIESVSSETMKAALTQMAKFTQQPWLKQTENVWQEIVKGIKDIIVIKSGVVLLGNIISNVLLLSVKGVNPAALIKNHAIAIEQATAYQRDTKELSRLERIARIGEGSTEDNVKIARLKNRIANNKVKELIDEGIYQSIVEDISTVDDTFTYKNKLETWASPVTDKIPSVVKDGLKVITIAQDTKAYKFLRDTTQMSDFVARYTLHEANLAKGMSKEKSIEDIVRTFIDYDSPTHKGLQYANDMGVVMFTKFFIRIQRVLADLVVNHPGKVLSIALLQNMLGELSDVMDSNVFTSDLWSKINLNPFGVLDGILALPIASAAT